MCFWRHRAFLTVMFGIFSLFSASSGGETLHYHIDASLDEGNRLLRAHQVVVVTNWAQVSLTELYFHLFANSLRAAEKVQLDQWSERLDAFEDPLRALPRGDDGGYIEIGSVLVDGHIAEYVVQETWMVISLPEVLPPGGRTIVKMEFWVKIPRFNAYFGYWKGIYTMAKWYPQLAYLSKDGWLYEERVNLQESLANFADYWVRLRLPVGMVVAATGNLERNRGEGGEFSVQTWSARRVRCFGWVGSTRFLVSTSSAHGVAVSSFYLPRHRTVGALVGVYARRALLFYGARLGSYPQRQYAVVETHLPLGGLSLPGLCLLSSLLYDLNGLSDLLEVTVAHEAAHQWWGEKVDAREPWFCEGFAKFWESAYMCAYHGTNGRLIKRNLLAGILPRLSLSWLSRSLYLNLARFGMEDKITLMAGQFRESLSHQGAVYAKAPLVLQMLASLLGDDGFLLLCRRLLQLPDHTVVTTAHVMDVTREVARTDMEWFFQQWFETVHRCDYAIVGFRCRRVGRRYITHLSIDRRGDVIMPLEVTIILKDGSRIRKRWNGRARKQELLFSSSCPARGSQLASGLKLLDFQPSNNFYPRKNRIEITLWPLHNVISEANCWQIYPSARLGSSGGRQIGIGVITRGMVLMSAPFMFQPEHGLMGEFRYRCQRDRWCWQIGTSMRASLLGNRTLIGVRCGREGGKGAVEGTIRWIWSRFLCKTPYQILKLRGRYRERPESDGHFSFSLEGVIDRRRTVFYPTFGDFFRIIWERGFCPQKGISSYHRISVEIWRHHLLLGNLKYSLCLFGGLLLSGSSAHEEEFDLERDAHMYGLRKDRDLGNRCLSISQELGRPLHQYLAVALVGRFGLLRSRGSQVKIIQELGVGLRLLGNSPLALQIDLLSVYENMPGGASPWRPAWNIRMGARPKVL